MKLEDLFFCGHNTELPEMLGGRENRARHQQMLLEGAEGCLISFTLNIAGPVKVNAYTIYAFNTGCREIKNRLHNKFKILHSETVRMGYGFEAFYVVDASAGEVKAEMMAIEEEHPLGRLFDIDVLGPDGVKESRPVPRKCLICGNPAADCASMRTHSVFELQEKTKKLIRDFWKSKRDIDAGALAYGAMLAEVSTTPKPGLVDMANNGAHKDMDYAMFERSACAISPYFGLCYYKAKEIAKRHNYEGDFHSEIFDTIRSLGIGTEGIMFAVTGGVNTHKGLIFSLGLISAAMGTVAGKDIEKNDFFKKVLHEASVIALPAALERAAGGGIGTGARGQAAKGFPGVEEGIKAYEAARACGLSENDAGVYTLIKLMADTEDTNMVKRGGWEMALEMKERAKILCNELCLSPDDTAIESWKKKVSKLDDEFIKLNLSPGGCADILAITFFFEMTLEIIY